MIIINFLIEACFVGYIGAMLIFLGPYYIYNIYYNRIRDLFDDPMYIVFKDIFIFRCVFGLTKKVWDLAQGFKYNIIRP